MPAPNAAETAKTESANPDDFLDPDEVVAEDGKETDDTFFWKVRSRALAKTLETSLDTFAGVAGLVKGNDELANFSRVRTIMDVSRAFTDERARTFRGERGERDDGYDDDDDEKSSVVVDSLVTIDEAIRELDAMREGTVGLRVGRTFAEAFLKRGNAYDCVSHEANEGWSIRKGCSGETLLRRAEQEDAEIVILETVV